MSYSGKIFIYTDHPSSSLNISEISEFLRGFGFEIQIVGDFIGSLGLSDDLLGAAAYALSGCIVDDTEIERNELAAPKASSPEHENSRLLGKESAKGVLYDGFWLQRIFYRLMFQNFKDQTNNQLHLIFTGRLFGTFENRRYHARVLLTGTPTFISTSGLVEAPAKPREYYFIKGGLIQSGKDLTVLDEMYKGRFVEYDDPKITSIIKSYALQAIFCEITGNPFCDNSECCLYNSHWQEDVLSTQYDGKLCGDCSGIIKK